MNCTRKADVGLTPQCDDIAGTDMALAYVARHHGEEAAEDVAGFLEYTGDFRTVGSYTHELMFVISSDRTMQGTCLIGL